MPLSRNPWFSALAAVTPHGTESRSCSPLSLTQRSHGGGIDNNWGPALISNYTGKEVVGWQVLKAVVGMFKDQVRWLRLRAGRSKRGFGPRRKTPRQELQPAHYR